MGIRIHDWMDDWFLSFSENPDKLDKAIRNYEKTRMIGIICFIIVAAMNLLVIFKSANPTGNGFMFSIFLLMMIMVLQTDNFTKLLKLQRQNLKNNRLPNN